MWCRARSIVIPMSRMTITSSVSNYLPPCSPWSSRFYTPQTPDPLVSLLFISQIPRVPWLRGGGSECSSISLLDWWINLFASNLSILAVWLAAYQAKQTCFGNTMIHLFCNWKFVPFNLSQLFFFLSPPWPLATTYFFSVSVTLFLFCFFHLFFFLDSIYVRSQSHNIKNASSSNRKWTEDLHRYCFHRNIQMANRYMKKGSASLIIREVQIKTTVRYHLTHVRTTVI